MIDVFTDSNVLALLSFADFRFWVAILAALLISWLQSLQLSSDSRFQGMYFWIAIGIFTLFFGVNILLTKLSSMGSYRPWLIGAEIYDYVINIKRTAPEAVMPDDFIQNLLYQRLGHYAWPAFLAAAGVIVLGIVSVVNPPPNWRRGLGVDVLRSDIPNLIDYSIRTVIYQNIFIGAVLVVAMIMLFDLVQLSNLQTQAGAVNEPPMFFKERNFDRRFFVFLALGPFILVTAFGKVWQIRYRMTHGGLTAYRPEELRKLANLYRLYERHLRPILGPKQNEEGDGVPVMTDDGDETGRDGERGPPRRRRTGGA